MPQLEALSPRLVQLEAVIDRGRRSFIEVGRALLEIRDGRLYKQRGYPNFDDYCHEHLGFQRAYAGHLIRGAQAVAEVATNVATLPANEGQARELARAPEGQRAEVWQKVVDSGEPVTASRVRAVVDAPEGQFEAPRTRIPRQPPSPEETFREMLASAVSYGIIVAELSDQAVRGIFEDALRSALRELQEMA